MIKFVGGHWDELYVYSKSKEKADSFIMSSIQY